MRFERLVVALAMLVATSFISVVAFSSQSAAAGSCPATLGNYWDGYYADPQRFAVPDYEGASAYIVPHTNLLCTPTSFGGDKNFTDAWVMIAGWDTSETAWAQVGFEVNGAYGAGDLRWFSQLAKANQITTWFSPGSQNAQIGVRHTFRELWSPSCFCEESVIDTTIVQSSGWNPFDASSGWGPRPWSTQFSGEVGSLQTDVVGSPGAHVHFTSLGGQRVSDDALEALPCILSQRNDSARWAAQSFDCDDFDIWTATP